MPTIELPMWVVISAIGVPCLFLLGMVAYLLRRMRITNTSESNPHSAPVQSQSMVHSEFHQDLLALQIDTIFNGLVAIIETERLKVKSLLDHSITLNTDSKIKPPDLREEIQWEAGDEDDDNTDIGQRIVECSVSGMNPGEIAHQLGISQAEVALAMKMLGSSSQQAPRKLEAVA